MHETLKHNTLKLSPTDPLSETLFSIADFYEECKYGYEGCEGYRKSTDLRKFTRCAQELQALGFIHPDKTVFTDLGCADGRVNVMMSYFVRKSIGIEIDPDILAEFAPRKAGLVGRLQQLRLLPPPDNIYLLAGSSLEAETYRRIATDLDVRFTDVDLFYTYIFLHDVYGEIIASEARSGALYLVYGFSKILPRYEGLEMVLPDVAGQGIAALYRKL